MQTIRQDFEAYLAESTFENRTPHSLYESIDYVFALGGKRMRPLLVLLSCQLFNGDHKNALPIAYAVETFHNFSLVHDDIMDDASLRRGQPTVHEKYSSSTAILSGNVMLLHAYSHLFKMPEALWPKLLPVFTETSIGVCDGQQLDVDFETQEVVTLKEYIRMIELKTSILLYASTRMGAIAGGASDEEAELAGEFGRNMGIAFQIKDDWLDTYGTQAKVGKRIGGDIVQNKKTALVIKALELADEATAARLNDLLSTTPPTQEEHAKIAEVTQIFTDLGIPDEMRQLMEIYRNKAKDSLDQLTRVSNARKKPLYDFLEALMVREN